MKVQIIYTSLTGCTEKVAKAVYDGIEVEDKSIHNLKDGVPEIDGDVVIFGYWGNIGKPESKMIDLLKSVKGKYVGVFCTLGYYADSIHARDTLMYGMDILKENNTLIGGYIANGAISKTLKAHQGLDKPHTPTTQDEIRWEITDNHPTKAECDLAAERFNERIYMVKRCTDLKIPFKSIL